MQEPFVLFCAGEDSGDVLGEAFVQSIVQRGVLPMGVGGRRMQNAGLVPIADFEELPVSGYLDVLPRIARLRKVYGQLKNLLCSEECKAFVAVDYPGFNLDIAKFVKAKTQIPVYYYISPKIWAWKEYRIKNIKRDVSELFSILPFEVDFFEGKHHYPIHYVGNPTADEVRQFKASYQEDREAFCEKNGLEKERPIIALLAGSRRQEIKDNLPAMIQACDAFPDYQLVLAGAPAIDDAYYDIYIKGTRVRLVKEQTYALLSHAHAALVTSGTATLETALFRVPQVVCYETPLPRLIGYLRKKVLSVRFVSLVNLIADREVVPELVADSFTMENIRQQLRGLLEGTARQQMLDGYEEVARRLGEQQAPREAAQLICELLKK